MSGDTLNLPFRPKWSKQWIEKKLSERYFKKPYDRFMWWRGYTLKNKPLGLKQPLRARIANGDFDTGPYLLEVELCLHKMNEKYLECVTPNGEVDQSLYHSETSIDRARKKRLIEDLEKDEFKKLDELKTSFCKIFGVDRKLYEKELMKSNLDLLEFYDYMEKKFKKRLDPVPKFRE